MPNGVYTHKAFDDDLVIHRTFVDPPTNDRTTEEPEKGELEKLQPVPFHQLVSSSIACACVGPLLQFDDLAILQFGNFTIWQYYYLAI